MTACNAVSNNVDTGMPNVNLQKYTEIYYRSLDITEAESEISRSHSRSRARSRSCSYGPGYIYMVYVPLSNAMNCT